MDQLAGNLVNLCFEISPNQWRCQPRFGMATPNATRHNLLSTVIHLKCDNSGQKSFKLDLCHAPFSEGPNAGNLRRLRLRRAIGLNGFVDVLKDCFVCDGLRHILAILSVHKPLVLNFSKNVDFYAVNHHQIAVVSSFEADV